MVPGQKGGDSVTYTERDEILKRVPEVEHGTDYAKGWNECRKAFVAELNEIAEKSCLNCAFMRVCNWEPVGSVHYCDRWRIEDAVRVRNRED